MTGSDKSPARCSGPGPLTRPPLPPVYVEKGYVTALREVLAIVEAEKYVSSYGEVGVIQFDPTYACDAARLTAKLKAMLEDSMNEKEINELGWELLREEDHGPNTWDPDYNHQFIAYRTKEEHQCPLCLDNDYSYISGVATHKDGDSDEIIALAKVKAQADCVKLMRLFKVRRARVQAMIEGENEPS